MNRDPLHHELARHILSENKIFSCLDNGQMYIYNGGYFHDIGENTVKEIAERMAGNESNNGLIGETVELVRRKSFIERKEFLAEAEYIPFRNGVWSLNEHVLKPHMWNYMFQFQVPHDYDPKIRDCPAIHRFFQQVVHKNDVQAVYELFAYCLFRSNPYQKAFMLVGSGSNGKSTLLSLLNEFIGPDNSCNVELQEFDENRFSKSRLYNKHVNFFADLPQRALKGTGIFKSITGGDFVEGEKKFKDSFSFRPFAKLVFSANMVPRSEDDTDAFYRRWVIINFPNQFEGKKIDPYLLPKLTSEPEMQGLLFRCMSILPKLLKMGFTARYTTGEMRKMYTRLSDPVGNFIDERINIQSEKWVSKKELFDRFIKYCRKGNYPIVSEKTFSKALMSMIPSIGQARPKFLDQRIRAWTGISFIVEENEEEISHQWE